MVSECAKLAQREYTQRHEYVVRYLHWVICDKVGFARAEKWYNQKPEGVLESETHSFWGFNIQFNATRRSMQEGLILTS